MRNNSHYPQNPFFPRLGFSRIENILKGEMLLLSMPKHVFANGRIDPRNERTRDKQRRAGYLISNILNDRIDVNEMLSYEDPAKSCGREIKDAIFMLKSKDPTSRMDALERISKYESSSALCYLIESLNDGSSEVRQKSAMFLKEKAIKAYKNEDVLTISQLLIAAKKLADLEAQAMKSKKSEKEISDALDVIIRGY